MDGNSIVKISEFEKVVGDIFIEAGFEIETRVKVDKLHTVGYLRRKIPRNIT